MKYNRFTIYEMLQDGFNVIQEQNKSTEKEKRGTWRGGSAGCITADGRIIGADPRKTVLRFLGIEKSTSFDTNLMFQGGYSNEESWKELLDAAGITYRAEDDIPMRYTFDVGGTTHTVTGRPDLVIGNISNDTFIPEVGMEFKLVCSFHTAIKVANFGDNAPKTDHIVQAAGYSDFFGIPWVLAYTSRVNWAATYGNPSRANPTGRWQYDHRALKKDDKGRVYNLNPFISMYDLTWDNGTLLLDGEPTAITSEGIRRYYEYCARCIDNHTVPMKRSCYDYIGNVIPDDKNDNLRYDEYVSARTDSWDNWVNDCREISKV